MMLIIKTMKCLNMCITNQQVEDVSASNDEVDGPPDGAVETSKSLPGRVHGKISKRWQGQGHGKTSKGQSYGGGDELWSDDERPINTVLNCYVKVSEPPRATTADR